MSYTLTQLRRMSERGSASTSEIDLLLDIIFMSLGFTAAIGAYSIYEEVVGFSPLWFLEENICVYCLL